MARASSKAKEDGLASQTVEGPHTVRCTHTEPHRVMPQTSTHSEGTRVSVTSLHRAPGQLFKQTKPHRLATPHMRLCMHRTSTQAPLQPYACRLKNTAAVVCSSFREPYTPAMLTRMHQTHSCKIKKQFPPQTPTIPAPPAVSHVTLMCRIHRGRLKYWLGSPLTRNHADTATGAPKVGLNSSSR